MHPFFFHQRSSNWKVCLLLLSILSSSSPYIILHGILEETDHNSWENFCFYAKRNLGVLGVLLIFFKFFSSHLISSLLFSFVLFVHSFFCPSFLPPSLSSFLSFFISFFPSFFLIFQAVSFPFQLCHWLWVSATPMEPLRLFKIFDPISIHLEIFIHSTLLQANFCLLSWFIRFWIYVTAVEMVFEVLFVQLYLPIRYDLKSDSDYDKEFFWYTTIWLGSSCYILSRETFIGWTEMKD